MLGPPRSATRVCTSLPLVSPISNARGVEHVAITTALLDSFQVCVCVCVFLPVSVIVTFTSIYGYGEVRRTSRTDFPLLCTVRSLSVGVDGAFSLL